MRLSQWHGIVLILISAALVVTGAACSTFGLSGKNAGASQSSLVIRDQSSGKVYGKWSLEEGEEFAIEFIHSVHQSPVREFFLNEEGRIRPIAVRFHSFGAGMLSDLGEGQTYSRDGDAMVISGFTASFKELNCVVGTVSDHLLIVKDEFFSLRDLCGRSAHVKMYIE